MSPIRPWLTPVALLLLGSISVAFGIIQSYLMLQPVGSDGNSGAESHYLAMPAPIVLHIIAGSIFNLLMPLQFAKPVHHRWPAFHKSLGKILALCVVSFGLSGLWMNHFYPQYGGVGKYVGVMAQSILLLCYLILSLYNIRRGRIDQHRAWMVRMVAAALAPATQRLIVVPSVVIFGDNWLTDSAIALVIWVGLLVNLLVAERILAGERSLKSALKFSGAPKRAELH
ncbi:DUF2306 domain-containing protein [Teredinibacter turnerae]|uniref:DUF2306 domain-containing protein n=1 Tax=Teredinibacter turnerae TaxID=2426 RepID=UPI0003640DEA|nr:DUF2306 domain-containing protein [Teredinibacter turnerae]